MYAYFIGRVTEYTADGIVLEANNVGYNIKVTGETREILASRDGEVKVYTYTYVKEDTLSLFGFLTREELSLFEKMLTVSGIGPKGALAILAALPYDALIYAILTGDAKSISKAQGIGSKTAQRLIIDFLRLRPVLRMPFREKQRRCGKRSKPVSHSDIPIRKRNVQSKKSANRI